MADDFLIRIIPEGFSGAINSTGVNSSNLTNVSSKSGFGDVAKSGVGFISKVFGAVLKGLGIGSIVGMVVTIASELQSLVSIIFAAIKLVIGLLKPIERVIITLLMPILYIIKPIVILINQVMSPFIKLAMDMMRQGSQAYAAGNAAEAGALFAGAGAVALQGLSAVIVAITAELLKLTVDNLLQTTQLVLNTIINVAQTVTTAVLGIFGVSSDQISEVFDNLRTNLNTNITFTREFLKTAIDTLAGNAVVLIAAASVFTAESLGVSTKQFQKEAKLMIQKTFIGAKGINETWDLAVGTAEGFGKIAKDMIDTTFTGKGGINENFVSKMKEFQNKGTTAVKTAVDAINSEWNKLNKAKSDFEKEKEGFFEKAGTCLDLFLGT